MAEIEEKLNAATANYDKLLKDAEDMQEELAELNKNGGFLQYCHICYLLVKWVNSNEYFVGFTKLEEDLKEAHLENSRLLALEKDLKIKETKIQSLENEVAAFRQKKMSNNPFEFNLCCFEEVRNVQGITFDGNRVQYKGI